MFLFFPFTGGMCFLIYFKPGPRASLKILFQQKVSTRTENLKLQTDMSVKTYFNFLCCGTSNVNAFLSG